MKRYILAIFVILIGSCALALGTSYEAETADGRVKFTLERSSAEGAFSRFCNSQKAPACDEFEAYNIEVSVRDQALALNFSHRNADTTSTHPGFACLYDDRQFNCFEGRHL